MPTAPTFAQKYGALLLSVGMAFVTLVFHYAKGEHEAQSQKERSTRIEERQDREYKHVDDMDRNGSIFAKDASRATQQTLAYQSENIADIKKQTERVVELLGAQREATAEIRQQVAYLVQICGKQGHTADSSMKPAAFALQP